MLDRAEMEKIVLKMNGVMGYARIITAYKKIRLDPPESHAYDMRCAIDGYIDEFNAFFAGASRVYFDADIMDPRKAVTGRFKTNGGSFYFGPQPKSGDNGSNGKILKYALERMNACERYDFSDLNAGYAEEAHLPIISLWGVLNFIFGNTHHISFDEKEKRFFLLDEGLSPCTLCGGLGEILCDFCGCRWDCGYCNKSGVIERERRFRQKDVPEMMKMYVHRGGEREHNIAITQGK